MGRYLVRRLLQIVPMLLGVGTLVFLLVHGAPGGPVVALAGEFVTAEYQAAVERLYGLDRPLGEQYLRFILLLLQGELGRSYTFNAPVADVILARLPATLLLIVPAIAISAVVGVWLAAVVARRRGGARDVGVIGCMLLCHAVPVFWLGQILLFVFAVRTELFPTHGMSDPRIAHTGVRYAWDVAQHLVLPCLTLVLHQLAFTVFVARAALAEQMRRDYFTAALAKGLTLRQAEHRHALPNAMLPVVTLIGNRVGWLIAGTVLVENVFAWPGIGRLVVSASLGRDYPLIIGVTMLVAAVTLVANLITDLVYTLLDPRIRLGRAADAD